MEQSVQNLLTCKTLDEQIIALESVASSQIIGVGLWDGRLYVKFTNYSVYAYDHFTKEKFDQMLAAESKGKWFNLNVKHQLDAENKLIHPFRIVPQ